MEALSAADAIQGFVQGRDARQYADDALLHSAVERKFEIIGEALGQLAKFDAGLASQ
ncbi:HepT-like ribonuclease domain-containing protein, partial [Acinetobacter baumannii]